LRLPVAIRDVRITIVFGISIPLGEMQWLEGGEAIEAMIALHPGKLPRQTKKKAGEDARSCSETIEENAENEKDPRLPRS